MKTEKKVVYQTQWSAKDKNKEYQHGWGFDAPLVEFPQNMDPALCSQKCKELSDAEFECYGAVPVTLLVVQKQIYSREEVVKLIDDLLQHSDAVSDAITSENPERDAEELLEMVEKWQEVNLK